MTRQSDAVVNIVEVEHVEGYKLRLRFSDGKENLVDFRTFLTTSSNPMIRVYMQPERFKNFSLRYGDLLWNDYDLCFPIADLYEGRI